MSTLSERYLKACINKYAKTNRKKYFDEYCSAWNDGAVGEQMRRAPLDKAVAEAIKALDKIADPRKRDHKEPDAYTTLGCVMHIADEALQKLEQAISEIEG